MKCGKLEIVKRRRDNRNIIQLNMYVEWVSLGISQILLRILLCLFSHHSTSLINSG